MRTILSAGLIAFAAAGLMALPAGTAGATNADDQPVQTTATYGDWTVRCRADANKKELCEMLQVVRAKNQQAALANIAVGRLPNDETMRIVVQLPIAVHLPGAVNLKVGAKVLATAQFQSCFQAFCLARADLTPEASDAFKKARTMTIAFQDRSEAEKTVPVSLMGFTAAFKNTFERDPSGS